MVVEVAVAANGMVAVVSETARAAMLICEMVDHPRGIILPRPATAARQTVRVRQHMGMAKAVANNTTHRKVCSLCLIPNNVTVLLFISPTKLRNIASVVFLSLLYV